MLSYKLSVNASRIVVYVDVFNRRLSQAERLQGFVVMDYVFSLKRKQVDLSPTDACLLVYYEGLFRRHLKNSPTGIADFAIHSADGFAAQDGKAFRKWLVRHLMEMKPDVHVLYLSLQVNLLDMFDNLVFLRRLLTAYQKESRRSLRDRLDFFHM